MNPNIPQKLALDLGTLTARFDIELTGVDAEPIYNLTAEIQSALEKENFEAATKNLPDLFRVFADRLEAFRPGKFSAGKVEQAYNYIRSAVELSSQIYDSLDQDYQGIFLRDLFNITGAHNVAELENFLKLNYTRRSNGHAARLVRLNDHTISIFPQAAAEEIDQSLQSDLMEEESAPSTPNPEPPQFEGEESVDDNNQTSELLTAIDAMSEAEGAEPPPIPVTTIDPGKDAYKFFTISAADAVSILTPTSYTPKVQTELESAEITPIPETKPSSAITAENSARSEQPARIIEQFQGPVFTVESNLAAGIPVYTSENPAPKPPVAFTPEGNRALGIPVIMGGREIADPEPTQFTASPFLPKEQATIILHPTASSYARGQGIQVVEKPEKTPTDLTVSKPEPKSQSEEITVITRRSDLLRQRNRLYGRAVMAISGGVAVAALAVIGLFSRSEKANLPTIPVSSASLTPQSPEPAPTVKAETNIPPKAPETVVERAIYKVNTEKEAYKSFYNYLSQAPGLQQYFARTVSQLTVHQFADQEAADQFNPAKKGKNSFLTGKEAEMSKRMTMVQAYFQLITEKPFVPTNVVVNQYFEKIRTHFEEFQKTGNWSAEAKKHKSDKFFEAFQAPDKFIESNDIAGYKPNLDKSDPQVANALNRMKRSAPTFEAAFEKAVTEMAPSKYNDFGMIKKDVCAKIKTIADANPNPDYKSGVNYMHNSWCNNGTGPNNDLDPAINNIVEVPKTAAIPAANPSKTTPPPAGNIHNSIAPDLQKFFTPIQPGERIHRAVAPAEEKPGFIKKTTEKIKSFFGFGNTPKSEQPTKNPESNQPISPNQNSQPRPTKADLPMTSFKETLKGYFWG